MQRPTPWLRALALFLFLALAPDASAGGLVQLTLQGEIETKGGAYVEIEVAAGAPDEGRVVEIGAHFARYTTASELIAVLAHRLKRSGIVIEVPSQQGLDLSRATLFVENTLFINLRLGHGLWANVTLCDAVPASVSFRPPASQRGKAEFHVHASTWHAHTKQRNVVSVQVVAGADWSATAVAEDLVTRTIGQGWIAQRPTHDSWSPVKMGDGSQFTGFSLDFEVKRADWRVEILLPPRTANER